MDDEILLGNHTIVTRVFMAGGKFLFSLEIGFCMVRQHHNVLFVWYVFLPAEQVEIYPKINMHMPFKTYLS